MILGKPTGISLKAHTENVLNELYIYVKKRRFVLEKYQRLVGIPLNDSLELICKYHDLGKKQSTWQLACQKEFEEFRTTKKVTGKYLRSINVRHELYSIIFCVDNGISLSDEEVVAIAAHHAKLSVRHEDKWKIWCNGRGTEYWKRFKAISFETEQMDFQKWIKDSYRYDTPRSILQIADKRASAKEVGEIVPEYFNFQYAFNPLWNKRPVQKLAEENAHEDLLLLRAPTGSGKTDASLLWAYQQIEVLKRADRLVIALPTRFTSNALALSITNSISETGLYHSTSRFVSSFSDKSTNATAKALETPVTVCTIDHLLICLSKTKDEHHHTFFNLANSCVVIDEADFYDEFTQANLLVLLESLQILRVPVLLMSASLPESSLSQYQRSGFKVSCIHEDTSDNTRARCWIREIKDYHDFDEIENILEETTRKPSIIFINTVEKAILLKLWYTERFPNIKVILYHSRFTEPDKLKKEEVLLSCMGKDAWANNRAEGVAILTQIGEMSVNISADFMLSEICPIDRLVQRIGRLSRFRNTPGELVILKPLKGGELYPAPYGTFEKRKWKINYYMEQTLNMIKCKSYNANDFVSMVNHVYKDGTTFTDKAIQNSLKLRELIKRNWLILPNFEIEEEETSGYWKTRNITGQTLVFVTTPEEIDNYYNSYTEFERIKISHGVTCPTYLVKKNLQEGKLTHKEVTIREEVEKVILLTSSQQYSPVYGLDLSLKEDDDQFL